MNSNQQPHLPFAAQRLVCFALLMGVSMYAIAVAVILQQHGGRGLAEEPNATLDTVVVATGVSMIAIAFWLRSRLQQKAEQMEEGARAMARFTATLVPLATLEGGCLFGLTVWLLNGDPVPSLVVALVLLSVAIYLVPFHDPNAQRRD